MAKTEHGAPAGEPQNPRTTTRPADAAPQTSVPNTGAAQSAAPAPASGRRSTFPTVVDLLVFFGIFFIAQAVALGVALLAGVPMPDTSLLDSPDEAVRVGEQIAVSHFNALTYGVAMAFTLVAFLIYRARRGGPRIVARFSLRGLDPVLLLWGVLFVFATSLVIEPLLELLPAVPNVYGRGVWSLLTLVVMAPLFEEVIFRGVLLESARARYGVVAGWLISSLIFGVVHIYPAVMVNAIIMGLILGFVYIRTASLWPAIILHAFNNGVAYLMLAMGRENQMLSDMIGNRTVYALLYTLALLVFLVSGFMVCRTLSMLSREEKEERAEKKLNAA